MAVTAHAHCDVEECEAEFVLENFKIACQVCKASPKKGIREIVSGPIMRIGSVRIGIVVDWEVDENDVVDKNKRLGVGIRFWDAPADSIEIGLSMSIINAVRNKTVTVGNAESIRANKYARAKHNNWGWAVQGAGGPSESQPLMGHLCHPTSGWLHDKALRVSAKVLMVTSMGNTSPGSLSVSLQHELSLSFKELFESKLHADLHLVVGSLRIEVHSLVLIARSPVFAAMLASGMTEATTKEVVINDLDESAMQELVSFLYTGCVPLDVMQDDNSAMALLKAAHRYECKPIVEACAQALATRLTVDSVVPKLEVADLLGCTNLRNDCLHFIHMHAADVLETPAYNDVVSRGPPLLNDLIKALAMPPKKRARN